MKRAKPSEVMAQIKSDIQQSISLFGNQTSFDPYGRGKNVIGAKLQVNV